MIDVPSFATSYSSAASPISPIHTSADVLAATRTHGPHIFPDGSERIVAAASHEVDPMVSSSRRSKWEGPSRFLRHSPFPWACGAVISTCNLRRETVAWALAPRLLVSHTSCHLVDVCGDLRLWVVAQSGVGTAHVVLQLTDISIGLDHRSLQRLSPTSFPSRAILAVISNSHATTISNAAVEPPHSRVLSHLAQTAPSTVLPSDL